MKKIILTISSLFVGSSLFAAFQMIEDFESGALSAGFTIYQEAGNFATSPTTTVVANPYGSGSALAIHPGVASTTDSLNQTIEFAIPSALQVTDPVTESKPVTFYFKMARPLVAGVPGEADITWGLADSTTRSAVGSPLAYGAYSVLGRIETNGIIDIRDGGSYKDLAVAPLETEAWYEFWFVVDHFTNTFTQYVKGGTDFATQTKVFEGAAYRNETVNNLDTMLFITSAGNTDGAKGKDNTYLSDFSMSDGENLTSPLPPSPSPEDWSEIGELDAGSTLPAGFTIYQEAGNFATSPTTTVVANPYGSGSALAIHPGVASTTDSLNQTIEFAIPSALQVTDPVTESKPVTFYFKMARPLVAGVPGEADITWGLADSTTRSAVGSPLAYGAYSVLGRIETNGIIDIRDGGSYKDLAVAPLETEAWYEFWFVVDHFTNTFTQYVKGGTDFATQTKVFEGAAYRNETVNNLDTMLFITSAGNTDGAKGKDNTYLSDFSMSDGENLTSPLPPAPSPEDWSEIVNLDAGSTLGADIPAAGGKLVNISTRGVVRMGDEVLIGGFVIGKDGVRVLVQAVGPELADDGVTGVLADPVLEIVNPTTQQVIATNDNWEDTQGQEIIHLWGGSPPLALGSLSSAVILTVDQGSYTAKISGKNGSEGVALVEVYEIE